MGGSKLDQNRIKQIFFKIVRNASVFLFTICFFSRKWSLQHLNKELKFLVFQNWRQYFYFVIKIDIGNKSITDYIIDGIDP